MNVMHEKSKKGLRPLFLVPFVRYCSILWPYTLVLCQFILLLFLARLLWHSSVTVYLWPVIVFTLAPAIWAVYTLRSISWGALPHPKAKAELVTIGPYRWVRHPMYTSVLAFALLVTMHVFLLQAFLLSAALLVVMLLKIRLEEQLLQQRYLSYTVYAANTGMLLPKMIHLRR